MRPMTSVRHNQWLADPKAFSLMESCLYFPFLQQTNLMKITILISFLSIPFLFAHSPDEIPTTRTPGTHPVGEGLSHHWDASRPDSHAPIGVMGDHTHGAGEFMLSYRYMFMRMEQNYDGTRSVPDGSFAGPPPAPFRVAPTDMDMTMHMIGAMYAPNERLTLMGMFNLVDLSMNHRNLANGMQFKTESSGLGDSSVAALYRFWENRSTDVAARAHLGLGLLLPTAETDREDLIPGPGITRLPYPMQLGAGSWGLSPSLTYLSQAAAWAWGGQVSARILLSDNDQGYRLGNSWNTTAWASRRLTGNLSISARLSGSHWGNIQGSDSDLLPLPVPTADPKRRGGSRLDASLGINALLPGTSGRLALEVGAPVWQDLEGPQLATEWWTTLGAQFSF